MTITKEEAACSIFNLEINQENIDTAIKQLESVGLVPVYFANGDPQSPFAIALKKVKLERWKYITYRSEDKNEKLSLPSSLSSYDVAVPTSKRAIIELLNLIIPPVPIDKITRDKFLTESDLFKIVKRYFASDWCYNARQLNNLIGKDGSWGVSEQQRTNDGRIRGRTYHVVKSKLRRFRWKDISNISQFRYLVRMTQTNYVTIGYVRKSNTTEPAAAKYKSLTLQAYNLKTKNLCQHVFASIDTNADVLMEDRNYNRTTPDIKYTYGDRQGK